MSKRNKGQHTSTGTSIGRAFLEGAATGVRPAEVDAAIVAAEDAAPPKAESAGVASSSTQDDAAPAACEGPDADLEVAPTDRFRREYLADWLPRESTSETPITDTINRMREQRDEQRRQAWIDQAFIAFAAKGHPLCKAWKEAHEAWHYRESELAKLAQRKSELAKLAQR